MLNSCLAGEKESHTNSVKNSKQKEDLAMCGKLPDYGDIQWYGVGVDTYLSQIAGGIYSNFHNPSWGDLKHHMCMEGARKKLLRGDRNYGRI